MSVDIVAETKESLALALKLGIAGQDIKGYSKSSDGMFIYLWGAIPIDEVTPVTRFRESTLEVTDLVWAWLQHEALFPKIPHYGDGTHKKAWRLVKNHFPEWEKAVTVSTAHTYYSK